MLSQQKVTEHYTALKSNTLQVPCIKTMHANTMHQNHACKYHAPKASFDS